MHCVYKESYGSSDACTNTHANTRTNVITDARADVGAIGVSYICADAAANARIDVAAYKRADARTDE